MGHKENEFQLTKVESHEARFAKQRLGQQTSVSFHNDQTCIRKTGEAERNSLLMGADVNISRRREDGRYDETRDKVCFIHC